MRQQADRRETLRLLSDLVSINSVNPAYDPESNEERMADYIEDLFSAWRIPFEVQPVAPHRRNLVARLEGHSRRTLLFEAHMDTASTRGMTVSPFDPRCEGDRLYGRGSCDTKGGLAAMLCALKLVKDMGALPKSSIVLAATVDEEHAFRGVAHLIKAGVQADGAVVAEPTDLNVVVAHKGCLRWKILTRGRAAHSSKPHLGVNAILRMVKLVEAIRREVIPAIEENQHPLLGRASLNIGVIQGGVQINMVPDTCEIELDRRLLPGETRDSVWQEFEPVLEALRDEDPSFEASMEAPMLEDRALETDSRERVVEVASEVAASVLGKHQVSGVPYGSDASKLSRAGIPSIVLGPGSIDQAHSAAEFVSIEQVVQAAEIYAGMMTKF